MKRFPFWWLNILIVVAYAVVALFINTNGQVLGLSSNASKFVIYALLGGGVGFVAFSLFKAPKKWAVPVLCLVVYLAFVI